MLIDDFRRRSEFIHRMTTDFVAAVPNEYWEYSPVLVDPSAQVTDPLRHGSGFAPFCKQLRHVVCVRGVYNAAMLSKRADFSKKHDHYTGGLNREELLAALIGKQQELIAGLESVDTETPIDFFGRAMSFGDFTYTVVQHEAIHHGQWSIYAALAGFETPLSWRFEWGL